MQVLFEFLKLLNRQNPAAIESDASSIRPFGSAIHVLPGLERQTVFQIEF